MARGHRVTVTVRLFAAAAEAVGAHEVRLDVDTVAELRAALGTAGIGASGIGDARRDATSSGAGAANVAAVNVAAAPVAAVNVAAVNVAAAPVAAAPVAAVNVAAVNVAAVIRQCAMLEAGVRREDDYVLAAGAKIDVMPPFAGG